MKTIDDILEYLIGLFKHDIDIYYKDYINDLKYIIDGTINNIGGKYDPSDYIHRNELEIMHMNIESKIDELFNDIEESMTQILKDAYKKAYELYDDEYDIILFNTKMDEALNSLWSGINYKDRLNRHRYLLKFQSNAVANNGIVNHMSNKAIKVELSKILSSQYNAMKSLSNTELTYIMNQATIDYCNANNIVEVEIVDDNKCCDLCRANRGKRFKARNIKPSDYMLHTNCRCRIKPLYRKSNRKK